MQLVSVIVPTTMSRRQFWPDALKSFKTQTYKHNELIFIVDTSDERIALETCIFANEPYPGSVIIVIAQGGVTLGEKRNIGCNVAAGVFVCQFDDDDLQSPDRIADQVRTLEDSGLAVTGYTDCTVHEMRNVRLRANGEWKPTSGWWELRSDYLMGGSLCFRKDWWESHRFESLQIGEDTAFLKAASDEHQTVAGSNGVNHYLIRNHHGNVSGRCITDDCVEVPDGGKWAALTASNK